VSYTRWISSLAAATFALTACSGNTASSQMPAQMSSGALSGVVHRGIPFMPPGLRTGVRPASSEGYPTNAPLIFVSDQLAAAVHVYPYSKAKKNPAPIATLVAKTGCPYGSAIDSKGNVFVVDNCTGNDIEEFPAGKTSPTTIITDGVSNPLGIAIDSKGTLYVSTYPASIQVYKSGAKSPSETITSGDLQDPFGVALDKKGDLFIADFGTDGVYEVKAGTTQVTALGLQGLEEPLGVAVNLKTSDLWVTDGEGNHIYVFPAGKTSPSETIPGQGGPYAIGVANQVAKAQLGVAGVTDDEVDNVSLYKPSSMSPFAQFNDDVTLPTGLTIAKP
jgi:DNA-binding beta-propeller fold protein YncE